MAHRIPAWVLALCCAASLSSSSQAQTSAASRYPRTVAESYNPRTSPKEREFPTAAQTKRAAAISIVASIVTESERYRDQTLKGRTQARAADALWDVDRELARDLFRRAWVIAEKVDKRGEQDAEEARKRFLNSRGGGGTVIPPAANLRSEVLKLAAQRDTALGNDLLARLDAPKESTDETPELKDIAPSFLDPTEPELAIVKRLDLAQQLLEGGDIRRAKAFATPALSYTTSQGIIFLCSLRRVDASGADELYVKLLTRAEGDSASDATTVSLLSSYAFTPNLLVTATRRGRVANQFSDMAQPYDLTPALRAQFLNVAASILLRPLPPPDQDRTSAGRAGTYFTIARLLPIFERYNSEHVPSLKEQLTLLSPDAPASFRNGEESMLLMGLVPAGTGETLSEILDQLHGTATSTDRDIVYVKAIRAAAAAGDPRAREFAEKIESADLKGRARPFADLVAVRSAINKRDVEGGIRIAREGYLAPLHRAWALAQIAGLLKKSDPIRAIQLLNEAAAEAKRIEPGEPERVHALTCVALRLFELDRLHAWALAVDVVKAANSVDGFSGEDGKLTARLRAKNVIAMINSDEPSFNAITLFARLGQDDLQHAISLVNNLTGDAPRVAASLAIARPIILKQKPLRPAARK